MTKPFQLIMLSATHEAGGNCLQRHLDSHPQLMVYPFESTIATPLSTNLIAGPQHWMPQRYAYPIFEEGISAATAYHQMADHELKTYLRARHTSKFKDCGLIMSEQSRLEAFWRSCEDAATSHSDWGDLRVNSRADYILAHFRATFEAWENFARTGRETHFVGYSPPILMDADKFFADFPAFESLKAIHGHMIHIVRNPFSGFRDTLKRPFPFPLERYCQLWNITALQAKVYEKKYPGRFHTVRYEDLVADPQEVLNDLCDVMGLEHFPGVPVPSFNRVPLPNGQVFPWGTIKQATTEANIATAKELTHEQAVAVYRETQPMLKEWNYVRLYEDHLW